MTVSARYFSCSSSIINTYSDFGKKFAKEKLLNTEKTWNGLVRLPIYPDLKIFDLKHITKSIEIFAKFL